MNDKMTKESVLKNALLAGIRQNKTDIVEFVLNKGFDPSFDNNWAVIHSAKNNKLEYIKLFLGYDSVVEKIEEDDKNLALAIAIRTNNVEIIEYFLSTVYKNMNDRDKDQLYAVAESYNKELVHYFE